MKSKYGSDQREANANLSLNGAKFYGIKDLPYQSQRSIKKFGEPWVRGFPKQAAEEITKKKEICLMADLTFFICHTGQSKQYIYIVNADHDDDDLEEDVIDAKQGAGDGKI